MNKISQNETHFLCEKKWQVISEKNSCDCHGSWTQNLLLRKQTLKHLLKQTKWPESICVYGAFDCMYKS